MRNILIGLTVLLGLILLQPLMALATTVFSQNQIILDGLGSGVVVSTSTALGAKLEASSTPDVTAIVATSTTATSFFDGFLSLQNWLLSTTTTVCAKGCQYSSIQSALNAGWLNIQLKPGVYSEQITIQNPKTVIQGDSQAAIIQCNGATQSPCISTNGQSQFVLRGFAVRELNAQAVGIAIDYSNSATSLIDNIRVSNFATSTYAHDTSDNTFYDTIQNSAFFATGACYDIGGTLANDNQYLNNRCQPLASGNATFGSYVSDAQVITFGSDDFEGTTTGNITGAYVDSASRSVVFVNPYVEETKTGISIAAGALNTLVEAGQFVSNTTDINDLSTTTTVIGAHTNDTGNTNTTYFGGSGTTLFGIGTTTPYAALSVVGASGVVADHYAATGTAGMSTSTFAGGISLTPLQSVNNSTSIGGIFNLNNTSNLGAGMILYTNAANALGRLFSARCDNALFGQDCANVTDAASSGNALNISATGGAAGISVLSSGGHAISANYTGTGSTNAAGNFVSSNYNFSSFEVTGQELTHGTIKDTHIGTAGGATDDSNAAALSIDLQSSTTPAATGAQGIFINATTGSTTGKLIQAKNFNTEEFEVSPDGNIGIGTFTARSRLDIAPMAFGEDYFTVSNSGSGNAGNIFMIASTSNVGIGSTSPGTLLSIGGLGSGINFSTATSTFTGVGGINLTSGCYAINGACIGGSGGGGTVTGVTGTWPIISSGGTAPVISFGGLSTSTAAVVGNIPYFSGVNTFANVATGTIAQGSGITITGTGYDIGSSIIIANGGLLSLQQLGGGTAQTGAITFATSTDSFNGLQANETITNIGGAFTFANNITGNLNIAGGGTNQTSFTTNGIAYFDGTSLNSNSSFILQPLAGWTTLGTTTSGRAELTVATSSAPQLLLTDGVNTPWFMRSVGSNFYMGTSSLSTFATSTNSLLSIIPSTTANATTTWSLTDWVQKQTSQTAWELEDAFGTIDALFNTASTTGSIFTVAATTSPSIGSPIKLFDVDQYGHITASSTGAAPTISSCGTGSPSLGTNSNDVTGDITTGTSASACTLTFAHAYSATPEVFITDSNTSAVIDVSARSTTAFTVSIASALSAVNISYFVVIP